VSRVVPVEKLLATADEMARTIASFSVAAEPNSKQAVVQGLDMSLQQGLELERRLSVKTRASANKATKDEVTT